MSKNNVGFSVHGYTQKKFSFLEGRIRTIIETVGLPDKQEKSLKDLVIGEIWSLFDNPQFFYEYEGDEQNPDCKLVN